MINVEGRTMSKVVSVVKQVWSEKNAITRNIWLAGLGVCDKGYEAANGAAEKSQQVFDELVNRGKQVESNATETIDSTKQQFSNATFATKDSVQEKVSKTLSTLTNIDNDKFDAIIDKIAQIEEILAEPIVVEKTVEEVTEEPVKQAAPDVAEAPKKVARKKPVTKRVRKPAKKKAE